MLKSKKLVFICAAASLMIGGIATSTMAASAIDQLSISIADTGGSGATLTSDLSPGVQASWMTTSNEYALSTMNTNAKNTYRLEYGVYSDFSGYYQQINSAADNLISLDLSGITLDGVTDPFSADGWPAIAGGS